MAQSHGRDQAPDDEEPTQPESSSGPADELTLPEFPRPDHGEADPTAALPARWTGSARVPEPNEKRRRKGLLRDPTRELPTVDNEERWDAEEPWPPPPPPRPANAPVTAPYPPPPYAPGPTARPSRIVPTARPPKPPRFGGRPPYRPPQVRRRRRRWPWVLGTMAALTLLCCGCCWSWIRPFIDEYPATATLPPQAAGLVKLDDAAAQRTVTELEVKVRTQHWLADQPFAGVYADADDRQRRVTLYGATMFVLDPEQELNGTFAELTEDFGLTDAQPVAPGAPGGHVRCGRGTADGQATTVCAWTDHGSKAVGIFPGRPVYQGADLIRELRAAVITRE
jgi:hypothetical protein